MHQHVFFVFNYYRQDAAKWKTAGIKFTYRPKIRFVAQQGRLVSSIHVKLGRADGHVGPLGGAKFHLSRHRGGNATPKYQTLRIRMHRDLIFFSKGVITAAL